MYEQYEKYKKEFDYYNQVVIPALEEYNKTYKKAYDMYSQLISQINFDEIEKSVSLAHNYISEYVRALNSPFFSAKKRQELLEAYRKYGEYGWTINLNDKYSKLMQKPPVDKKTADKQALHDYRDLEDLFNELSCHKRSKKSDLNEAICNYKDRRYKSCAMLLFSLIDALLIRFQRDEETHGKQRKVGKGAVDKAQKRVSINLQPWMLFSAIFCDNVFSCLGKMFEKGNDFVRQPDVINRNFLDHGMMTKPVRKKDCIQLFLLYYNLLRLMDYEYSVNKKYRSSGRKGE